MDRLPEPGDPRASQEWTRALPAPVPAGRGDDLAAEERAALLAVFAALQERGYDPVRQLAHFLVTGEPAYITAHRGARVLAQKLDRVRVVEALVRAYLVAGAGAPAAGTARSTAINSLGKEDPRGSP